MRTAYWRGVCAALLVLPTAACQEEVTGPTPSISEEEGQLPVDPGIICRAQLTTDVILNGDGFSPIPIDIPNGPKIALPSVTLSRSTELNGDAADLVDVFFSGTPDDRTNFGLLSWQSQEQMTLKLNQRITLPEDESETQLPVGMYDLLIENPNEEEDSQLGTLAAVDKPELEIPSPSIVCLDQGARDIVLSGTTFVQIDDDLPTLHINNSDDVTPERLDDCTDIAHDGIDAQYCETAEIRLARRSVDPGYRRLRIQNPETAACTSEEDIFLRIAPPPVLRRIVPPLACVEQEDRTFVIQGDWFLTIDGDLPALTLDGESFDVDGADNCEDLETMGHDVQRCRELSFTVPQGSLPPGQPEVVVQNPDPAGCEVSNAMALTIVPPPAVMDVEPQLVCVDDEDRVIDVIGNDFLVVDGEVPAVRIAGTNIPLDAITAHECEALAVDRLDVEVCDRLEVTIAQGSVTPGVKDVRVTNPDPAGCSDTGADLLAVLESPEVVSAEPPLLCTDDEARQLVVSGNGFLKLGDTLPEVFVAGASVTVDGADGCGSVGLSTGSAELCDTLNVTLPQGTLSEGRNEVRVQNPQPAGCDGASDVLTAPPAVTIVQAAPSNLCSASSAQTVTVTGTGFLRDADNTFQVFVDGAEVTPSGISDCTQLDVDGLSVESCDTFAINVDPADFPLGDVEIQVSNPSPSSCQLSTSTAFRIVGPPTVANVDPNNVCSDVATTFVVTGTGFVEGATVIVGDVTADQVVLNSDTELEVTFDSGLPAGTHDITVNNDAAGSCGVTVPDAVVVDPTPLVFFVDPPVLYNGIQVEATIFTSGLSATAANVELVDESGTATEVASFESPVRPNRIQAEIQAGLDAGSYEVRVTSELGCVGGLPGAVNISDSLTLDLQSIDPSFASANTDTAVTLSAGDPPGAGQAGFASTPRVYLDPSDAGSTATALRAVIFDSEAQATAVIPSGLDPGTYNLIVVNPSGEVGVLTDAVTITATEPPVVTAVVPHSLDNDSDQPARIVGENFDTGGVTVELECLAPGAATTTTESATVTNVTATDIDATLPSGGLTAGTVCIVIVTNSDGATYRFSAISAKQPSQNLGDWQTASALVEGRRALAAVAGRPTGTSRFVYAIGGDDGTAAGAMSSVEAAPVDVFGSLGDFTLQRNSLTAPRTLSDAATVGRFVYLVAGHDGSSATNTVLRAQVLDPLAGPEIVDLDAILADSGGVSAGQWFYRVSAVYPSTDPSNPGGESLPGEPFTVQLPSGASGIELTLEWEAAAGASGYRVYRSAEADGTIDDLELLAQIDCPSDAPCTCGTDIECRHTDTGEATDDTQQPFRQGALGKWHALSETLGTAREGHAIAAVENPNDATEVFLYAFGGRNASGTLLDSYEWATIDLAAGGEQTLSAWTTSTNTIGVAKADLAAWVVTNEDSSQVAAGRVQVFVGTGDVGAAQPTGEIASGYLDGTSTDGELLIEGAGTLDAETAAQGVAAAAYGDSSGYLFLFTGERASLTSTDSSSEVVAGPDLDNWNSLGGGSLSVRRAYADAVQESAFFFVLGGQTGADAASTSVERTVQ